MKQIGRTNLWVTEMGLGTAPFSWSWAPITPQQAQETVQATLEVGWRLFDTAPYYGQPGERTSEVRLGQALAALNPPRESYALATKVGLEVDAAGVVQRDLSREGIQRSLERSLANLHTDRLDIVHIHEPEAQDPTAVAGAVQILDDLRRQGILQAIGAGMNRWQAVQPLVELGGFDCFLVAGRFTLLEQGARPAYDLCAAAGISIVGAGVFNSGILATGPGEQATYDYRTAPAEILQRATHIAAICQAHGVTLPAAALHFARAHSAVATLVVGGASAQEIQANRAALAQSIPPALWVKLQEAGLIDQGLDQANSTITLPRHPQNRNRSL